MKAIWNGKVIAESDDTVVVEGNHYFPENSLTKEYFTKTEYNSVCPWKGTASYYTIEVDGEVNENSAWYYPKTSPAAKPIEKRVAFWKGIEVTK